MKKCYKFPFFLKKKKSAGKEKGKLWSVNLFGCQRVISISQFYHKSLTYKNLKN